MKLPCPKRPGFTLIEMLVAITIGGILLAGGIAAYRGSGKRITVKQAGEKLVTELRAAQKKALSGEKPTGCSTNPLNNYTVSYINNSSYKIFASCDSDNPITVNLPSGVEFDGNFSIEFPVLGGIVSEVTITLVHEDGGYEYDVTVGGGGVISGGFR